MGTSAVTVEDAFLSLISDWKLNSLYATSGSSALATYMEPWLLFSVQEFESVCNQDLTYSTTTQTFTEDLTTENVLMLARLMTRFWMQKTISDLNQLSLHIQDRDFSTHSAASNAMAKLALLNKLIEDTSQMLHNYGYNKNDWNTWGDVFVQ